MRNKMATTASSFSWSRENIVTLHALWDSTPTVQIADLLGTSRNSVIGKAHREKLAVKESPIKRKTRVSCDVPKKEGVVAPALPEPQKPLLFKSLSSTKPVCVSLPSSCQCHWPINNSAPWRFCKNAVSRGVYCEQHVTVAFVEKPVKKVRNHVG